jgi:hypothetical protein
MNPYIELLPIVADRGWRILGDGSIRDRDGRCPLCSLANEINRAINLRSNYWEALGRVGLAATIETDKIAAAADYPNHDFRPTLMAVLGMTE